MYRQLLYRQTQETAETLRQPEITHPFATVAQNVDIEELLR